MILRDGDSDLFLQGTQPQQLGLSNLGMVRLLRYCFHARGHSAVLQSSVQRKIRVTAPDLPNDDARNCRTEWPRLPLAGIANTTNAASARFATATNDDSGYTTIYFASTKFQSRCWIYPVRSYFRAATTRAIPCRSLVTLTTFQSRKSSRTDV